MISVNSLAALAGHLGHVAIRFELAGAITGAAVIGAWGGALLARRAPEVQLRRAFGIFVLLVAIWMLAQNTYLRWMPSLSTP